MTDKWRSWGNLIDSKVDPSSRWHSGHDAQLQSSDRIGDFLVHQLRNASQCINEDDEVVAEWGRDLRERLADYEAERRLLVKLASTGKVVRVLEHGIKTTLDILGVVDAAVESKWTLELQRERQGRVELYEALLRNGDEFELQMGDAQQQLEVLTLMKHGTDKLVDVLMPQELDLIATVYDRVVLSSNVVVGTTPEWFATEIRGWSRSDKSMIDKGEEACLRQVDTWAQLHHPHVRKFYGACHVGAPFMIHELTVTRYAGIEPWAYMHGCALGLKYVHERHLAHECLTFDNLHSLYEFKGMLSGLGLTRIKVGALGGASVEADVLAFGLAMFQFLVDAFSIDDSELHVFEREQRLPECCPSFFNDEQWGLLMEMCAEDPSERISLIEVTHRLESIQTEANRDIWSDEEDLQLPSQLVDDIDAYTIPDAGVTIKEILEDAAELCDGVEEWVSMNRPVYDRLADVHDHLAAVHDPLPLTLVEDYSTILWSFYLRLEALSQGDFSVTSTLCAANTIANRNYGLHHDIDRLILSTPVFQCSSPTHRWRPTWEQTLEWQQQALQKCLENPREFLSGVEGVNNKAEAAILLQYEGRNHENEEIAAAFGRAANLPRWLIPPHQIEVGRHLADGSFGAVYLGKWFSTDVVVKQVLTNQDHKENREQFFHEVNLWASLNHDNLIKLYGACHEGRPFFVCERANEGTLIKYIESRRQFPAWRAIWEAAKGLEYLHERGIVHGDLKGNNILVCDGTAKLADFGLSLFAKSTNPDSTGALGAFRWKAPECLAGSGPTFASDVYSFAMCIIEAISGDFPWGKSMPDSAVEFNVLHRRLLPRPKDFSDDQWDLVTRMCSFEPEDRPNATALVHSLWKFA